MKTRHIAAMSLLLAGGVALLALQRRLVTTEISPAPLLYLVADTEREAERIPLALTRVSDREENQIGQELARSYGLTPAIHKEADAQRIAAYVQEVGKRLTANVKRKEIQYRFYFKDEPYFVNAGALPGGQIVIGRGLVELLESEDELAAILGHEIAHVDERHAIERLQYEMQSRKIGMRGLYRIAQIGVVLFQMGYTKEKEDEADRVGLGLTVRAGYSPAGAVEVMKRFDRLYGGKARAATSPVEELAGMPLRTLGEYFRSHPPARERIATLEKEIRVRGYNAAQAQKPLGVRAIFLTEQAEVFDRHGMFDRAITRYQEALKVEPNYGRAWEALAKANWRSGNASETIKAATEAVRHNLNADEMWTLLAQGMVVEERQSAVKKYRVLSAEVSSQLPAMDAMKGVEWCGLRIYAGEKIEQVFPDYLNMLGGGLGARPYAQMQRRMAWWLYRAGRLEEALVELDAAKQRFPQGLGPEIDEAWVLADIGRYADAEKRLLGKGESGTVVMVTPENFSRRERENDTTEARGWALTAIINWKTDRREQANSAFKRAAELDPVWMVAKWVANNYSTEAAAVIAKLQAEELARRKKEEIRRNAAGNR